MNYTTIRDICLKPIPFIVAREMLESHHYLHSFPGGTKMSFGIFVSHGLKGAITLGAGPFLAYRLVEGAGRDNYLCLTRLWLSDELPRNSESRVIGILIRCLRRFTSLKFLVAYSDPDAGHLGTIYQATNWLYTGPSAATPQYDFGDGIIRHSRSVGQVFGTHSLRQFEAKGISVRLVPQSPKYRYINFIDPKWRSRLKVPVLPYPKRRVSGESS